ncbi:hypothetical protein MHM97_18255 [Epibacterium sp. Ofav1-8]|nr:hypothetical protein [Epibacterium sp. Ofav1-8]
MDADGFVRAMVHVEEIVDRESFKAWLEALPEDRRHEVAVTLATRCALRVFPIWAAAMRQDWARTGDVTPLPSLRSMLISGVAGRMPTPDIRNAAADAGDYAAASAAYAYAAADEADAAPAAYAAADAATDAASAADAAYAASAYAASAEIMSLLRQDIQGIDLGGDLLTLPLWPEEIPDKIATSWTSGRTWMQANPGYSFWIRWYEAVLAGRPLTGDWRSHWQLMQDIALIAPGDWDKGAEHVAGVIEKLEEKHSYRISTETQGEATTLLRAALGQFGFNDIRHLMELLPFAEDLKHLKDPDAVSDFVAGMDQQRHEIETFMRAVDREGRSLQGAGGILTYFEEVLTETSKARQLTQLNVGWIIDCGEILQGYAQNSETVAELGPLNIPFQRTVQNLLDLIHSHFSATLLRFGALRDIRSSDETRLADLMEDLRRGLAQIKEDTADSRVPMAPEAIAVFEKLLDDLDGMIQREFIAGNSAIKSQIRRDIDYRMAQVAVSLRLYWEQSAAPRMAVGQVISGVAKKKLKEGIEGLVQWALDW